MTSYEGLSLSVAAAVACPGPSGHSVAAANLLKRAHEG